MKKSTFFCPFCLKEEKLSLLQYRCINSRCLDIDDLRLTLFENGNLTMPKKKKPVFYGRAGVPFSYSRSESCPHCQNSSYKRVCPNCHNTVMESNLIGKDCIITVLGESGVGKSHFLGVLIKEFYDRIAVAFGGSFEEVGNSYQKWEKNFGRELYKNNKILHINDNKEDGFREISPESLIFRLKFRKKTIFQKIESVTFIFYEISQENMERESVKEATNLLLSRSDGFIFLHDPLKIPYIRQQMQEKTTNNGTNSLITTFTTLIQKNNKKTLVDKVDIPIAVVFPKFDMINHLIPSDSLLNSESPHCFNGEFSINDWHNTNTDLNALLKIWGCDDLLCEVESNYSKYSYFAISALGLNNEPKVDGSIDRPRPHRIEDPILWILKKKKLIK